MYNTDDNIVALATLPGKSALNVIRLSGERSLECYYALTKNTKQPKPRFANLSSLYSASNNQQIDQAITIYFKGPNSFTGEDMLEISVHGGLIIAKKIISELMSLNIRQALPGEFSYRAYINNKIDLIQAESITATINSISSIDSYYNLNNVVGSLSKEIIAIKNMVLDLIKKIEFLIDFDEEDIDAQKEINNTNIQLKKILNRIKSLIKKSYSMQDNRGVTKISIIGRPNVGKSSLFNKIINQDHSIISEIEGTTRDIIEKNMFLGTTEISLLDTAGIRKTNNKIEKIGIDKTLEHIDKSEIVVIVDDKNPKKIYKKLKNKACILVQNKIDKFPKIKKEDVFHISCKKNIGIKKLITHLSTLIDVQIDDIYKTYSFTINERQKNLLIKIEARINILFKNSNTSDLTIYASDLYSLIILFNDIYMPDNKNKIINEIFSGFCVGK